MSSDDSIENDRSYRVLSIQSHVVHGYVGNKVATFSLQLHGIEVDPINTVQFSNNTAYPTWEGKSLSNVDILDLYKGLCNNNLTEYTHVLTGYNNSVETLKSVVEIIKELKLKNENLIYVCDPVMGDHGKMYRSIDENIIAFYRNHVIPLATIVKLNQTEIEFLTDMKIKDDNDALKAIDAMHDMNVKNVFISSASYTGDENSICIIGSTKMEDQSCIRYKMSVPKLKASFTGTGDLFSSLLLAFSTRYEMDVSLQKTVSAIQHVLKYSLEHNKSKHVDSQTFIELEMVKSRKELVHPTKVFDIEYGVSFEGE